MLFCRRNATTGEGWLKNINQRAINSAQGVDFGVWGGVLADVDSD